MSIREVVSMETIKIIIVCLSLLIIATLAAALWVTTWSIEDRERREVTGREIIEAMREAEREE